MGLTPRNSVGPVLCGGWGHSVSDGLSCKNEASKPYPLDPFDTYLCDECRDRGDALLARHYQETDKQRSVALRAALDVSSVVKGAKGK